MTEVGGGCGEVARVDGGRRRCSQPAEDREDGHHEPCDESTGRHRPSPSSQRSRSSTSNPGFHIAADTGSNRPASADLITTLIGALSEQRDHLRAAAIVADVRLTETGSDTIRVTLEHSERIALTVLLLYKTRRFGRAIDYGDLQTEAAAAFHLTELSYFRRRFNRAVAA